MLGERNMRTVTTTRARLAAALAVAALVGGFAGPPLAGATRSAVRQLSGQNIARHSIPGNRLEHNTVTGLQIRERSLGVVPKASSLTPLHWVALHPIVDNGWHAGKGAAQPEIARDSQGIVHFRGAVLGDLNDPIAFVVLRRYRPSVPVYVPLAEANGKIGQLTVESNGTVTITRAPGDTNQTLLQIFLGGVCYARG
jgi:hypothetical protein